MSKESHAVALLREATEELRHARHWLVRSRDKCRAIDVSAELTEDQHDDIEAYTSRFARASDLLDRVWKHTPVPIGMIERTITYSERYTGPEQGATTGSQ
jgi:hypothetical protein